MSEIRIVNVASYNRIDSLVKSLESIIDQCDVINVSLNSHEGDIPEILYHNKVNLILSDNSLGDAMKFYMLDKSNGYYLTIDDDLIYPPTYVNDTIKKCKEFNNKKVVTYHGRSFSSFPIFSYYKSATERYACLNKVDKDVKVQFGGTGVMCFHTSLMKIPINYFQNPNMADVWVGKYCIENNIDIICLKHDEGYIKYIPQKTTIYDLESKNDKIQSLVVNSIYDKTIKLNQDLNNISIETKIEPKKQEEVKIEQKIELSKKQLNYEKINSIFQVRSNTTISKPNNQQNTNNLKLNSQTISKVQNNKKRFR
jgi:hypothetical protein